jgi:GntR family transcriptional regulator
MQKTTKPEPAFRRVLNDLRAQILGSEFPPDTALPTELELARAYAVSRQTVRRAFLELVAEDLVFRVPGRGTFVTPSSGHYLRHFGSIEDLMSLSSDSEMKVVSGLVSIVDPTAAGRLRLSDDRVASVTFVRLHQGEVFSITSVFLPPDVRTKLGEVDELMFPGTVSSLTLIGLLDRVLDSPIQDAEQSITVASAPAAIAEGLGLPPHTPVLRIDRMYFDTLDNPVELAISHYHPDRYSYRVRLRRNPT